MKKILATAMMVSALGASTAMADVINYDKAPVDYDHYVKEHQGGWMADVYGVPKIPSTYRFINSYMVKVLNTEPAGESKAGEINYREAPEVLSSTSIRKFTHVSSADTAKNVFWNIGTANTKSEINQTKEAKSVNWVEGAGQNTNYIEDNHTKISYETSVKRDETNPAKLHVHVTFTVSRDSNRAAPDKVADSITSLHTYNKDAVIDTSNGAFHYGRTTGYSVPVTFDIHDAGDVDNKLRPENYAVDIVINAYSQDGVPPGKSAPKDSKNTNFQNDDKDEFF